MPLYRPILKQALQITWRHKFLWFFGFFAGLLGNGGEYNLLISKTNDLGQQQTFWQKLSLFKESGWLQTIWAGAKNLSATTTYGSILILSIGLGIAGILLFLFIISQIALIKNTGRIQGKKPINLKRSFNFGKTYFFKALGLNIIYGLTLCVLVGALSVLFLFDGSSSLGQTNAIILTVISFVVFIFLIIVASFITRYALCYIVLEKQPLLKSIKLGFSLFLKNWLISLEMALVLFAINIAAGLVLMLMILIVGLPLVLLISLALSLGLKIVFWAALAICLLLILALIVVLGSSLSSFQYVSWALLYGKLVKATGNNSKIARLFDRYNKKRRP